MVTVGMYYDVISGKESAFEERFEGVLEALAAQPGHVQTDLYHQVKQPRRYAIFSEWEAREAFTTFIRSDLFREVTDWGRENILDGRPRHEIYDRAEGSA